MQITKNLARLTFLASTLSAVLACSGPQPTAQSDLTARTQSEANEAMPSESAKLAAFFERTFEEDLKRSPLFQTYLGIKWDYDKWDDISEERIEQNIEIEKNRLNEADRFDTSKLSEQEQLSLKLFKLGIQRNLNNDNFRHHSYIVHQFRAAHTQVPSFLINMHRVTDKSDAQAYISRLSAVNTYFDQVIAQMKYREAIGVFPPKWAYDQMIEAAQNVISGAPFDVSENTSTLWQDFNQKVDALALQDNEVAMLKAEAKAALLTSVKPAYENLIAAFKHQQALSPDGDGVWRLPEGDKWYKNRLEWFTTTDLTAEQVHQIGLDNVARIHQAMRDIMQQVGFAGDLPAFFEFMRTAPQFYYPNTDEGRDEYLTKATDIIDTMREALPDYFGLMPKAPIEVKRVEAFREKSAGKAFYNSPAQDGSRPGRYYANLYDMNAMPTYQMEALAYHEGIPGHHMQRAIATELDGIPQFQKFLSFTAYTEGWGLYSEELAKDMGFYQDPYSDFGRLAMELWRACRLVVDTGIHTKRWSREQAIQYLLENTPNPKYDAVKAIERYIAMPGQATAYMIGKLKIMALRAHAQAELGDKFSYAGFHDEVLKDGPVPLDILSEKVDRWIATQQ
ncbi:DUF885 domain-containing protein [Alteromonas lipolytica]|uniref:DUF885 domain-containing protein n=1 Tax=Alteromonas lipolytica TaxID=1856405 RepID=A0A1E8FJ70_9ALTE|nr:DUF885 domain-containing protein [Alteromonas lipolytica]OFI35989.1 hypothetical protein BFC17_09940 [Alteromonas lipolytica]GGF71888.1 hypothetical protein GCM10011338_25150 [Alteromonas lipolytica]